MKFNLKQCQQDDDWYCYFNECNSTSMPSIDVLFKLIDGFESTLKDDRRSLVKLGVINGQKMVAKQPRDKNRRKWMRFLSLFNSAEARKTFVTLLEFQAKGIDSLKPLCFLEQRRYGMVVDSWLLYEYREGFQSNNDYLPQIVETLKLLHSHGYRHEDPNYGNFLIDPNGDLFLIDCKGKPRAGSYSDYYDFMKLGSGKLDQQQVMTLIDVDKYSLGYWLARAYRGYIKLRTVWKKKIGRKRSKQEHD